MKDVTCLFTDILIIGGGIAALRAADKASQSGLKITIVIKDHANSSSSITGFNAVLRGSPHKDTCSIFFDDTVNGGCHLNNPELAANLTCRAESSVYDLIDMGVRFDMDGNRLATRQAAGSTVPRLVHYQDKIGSEIMSVLLNRLKTNPKVEFINNTIVIKLIKEEGMVRGVLALDQISGNPIIINSSSTIIATGGVGNLYSFSNALRSLTGDGFVLAKQAGARLRDMEFVQFEPFCFVYPEEVRGINIPTALFWDGASLTNGLGEDIVMKGIDGKPVPLTKGNLSRKIMTEIKAGRGSEHGGVFLDIRNVSEKVLNNYPKLLRLFKEKGLFPTNAPFEIAPAFHYLMGGIEIDSKCNTKVRGLMAVGEVAGGVHGAGRLSGNSGTEVVVFGAIAGEEAVRNIKKIKTNIKLSSNIISETIEEYRENFGGSKEDEIYSVEIGEAISRIMNNKVGVLREGTELSEALKEIRTINSDLKRLKASDYKSLINITAIKNMATIAEFVIKGVLARTESRGEHFRLDFQERDDLNFLKSIYC
ncbi:MAG: FAD-binding protein [Acetivibrionales bacterium]